MRGGGSGTFGECNKLLIERGNDKHIPEIHQAINYFQNKEELS
jgi:hypothetical protein